MARRRTGQLAIMVAVLSLAALSCSSGAKVDVSARCDLRPTSAKLILTKGRVVPADLTKTIGAPAARDLYATVCKSIVTAPVLPDQPHSCPATAVDPGTANVAFLVGDRRVDTVEMRIAGCQSIQSARVGGLGQMGADFGNFEKATLAIRGAFDVTDKAFRSR